MASHMEETRVQPANMVSPNEKSNDSLDEKRSIHSGPYEGKPTHINEFDAEGLETEETSELLVNDGNPFPPMGGPEETNQLTFRAVIIGSLLGLIVGASNIYLGLKTGFTFGASLFGAIFGFAILKPLSHALPEKLGGGYFGPKENTTVQTAATAAGGLTGLFVAAVPAMYHLKLLTTPSQDIGRLFGLTALTAFYGVFFAMPLRRYYILKEKLVFPTPTATAFTIRSLHSTTSAAARIAAKKKVQVLAGSFFGSFVFKSICGYAPGLLLDWHVFYWFYSWGWKGAIAVESWGWFLELTPAFWGAGMLSGLNASWSFLIGAIMAWGMLGPISIAKGWTISKPNPYGVDEPLWRNYVSMTAKDFIHGASPRYWLLWPGILIMLCYSFAELAMNAPIFIRAAKSAARSASYSYRSWAASRKGETIQDTRPESDRPLNDPAPEHEQVPFWMWSSGLIASVALTLIVGKLSYKMDVGVGILALLLAFIFSFIGVQSSGTTDVNPIGTIAKASQLLIGGVTRGQGIPLEQAQLTNLVAGSIAGQAAAHGVDMTGDLKTGHLLRASPRVQFLAQVLGSVIGIWLSVGLFVLFATAYPCITDLDVECTAFGLPSVSAWRTVAVAVTSPKLPIPPSSGYFAIGLSLLAIITVVVKHTLIPARFHAWVPNWNAIGLGFVVPQTYYPIAMVVGAHLAYTWARRWPKSWEIWGFALSAGLVAGEGMGGVLTALLTIVKADGSYYGSAVACPAKEYCG
ncbi:hypothetical protein FRC14_000578 [Serendipita sp. 396]|nr:hypothetical protein FRC14_000578 [Serendipita sp. 396]KAG8788933.1 hypothetical protein FRC15_000965 [Serendipita sp. 397]KAG8804122.1 hypothetical protein FRC16_000511 [Serendipita sp. 398]KAG8826043.1 hypothetical protein FRC19_009826 [Serendipita sp. 401]KAG8829557.1 hypothetical protein FRC18_009231 [Serendipita sp. 400]KAG8851067.1 hypothetical protein FRB91_008513 [Serendipita sp. 411]KAG8876867.1 hypothetical protein FRC20_000572 [Serendipita sp. 405]KAG9056833.1 hypothetical prot